jgi:hypothetical protein
VDLERDWTDLELGREAIGLAGVLLLLHWRRGEKRREEKRREKDRRRRRRRGECVMEFLQQLIACSPKSSSEHSHVRAGVMVSDVSMLCHFL